MNKLAENTENRRGLGSMIRLALCLAAVLLATQLAGWATASGAQTQFHPYQQAVLDDGPSLYVTFDESADDISGSNLITELATNGTLLDSNTPLGVGRSLTSVSSSGQSLNVPDAQELSLIHI